MSVNAGEIYVDIAARLDKLEAGLNAAKTAAGGGGTEAGKRFGYAFGDKFAEQSKGVIGQLAGPMMAASLAKAAAGVLRSDKQLPEAILDGLKTIPFVGAFVDLGSAIYDATFGAADKAAEDLIAKQSAARDMILKARAQAAQEEKAAAESAFKLTNEREILKIQQDAAAVALAKGEREAIDAERNAKSLMLMREMEFAMANGISQMELDALAKLNTEKSRGYDLEREKALRALEDRQRKEQEGRDKEAAAKQKELDAERKVAEERTRSARESASSAAGRLEEARALAAGETDRARTIRENLEKLERFNERDKALREAKSQDEQQAIRDRFAAEEELAILQQQQADAAARAANATTSANTALGQFTFDAYPKEQQRSTDERIARGVERTAERIAQFGVF